MNNSSNQSTQEQRDGGTFSNSDSSYDAALIGLFDDEAPYVWNDPMETAFMSTLLSDTPRHNDPNRLQNTVESRPEFSSGFGVQELGRIVDYCAETSQPEDLPNINIFDVSETTMMLRKPPKPNPVEPSSKKRKSTPKNNSGGITFKRTQAQQQKFRQKELHYEPLPRIREEIEDITRSVDTAASNAIVQILSELQKEDSEITIGNPFFHSIPHSRRKSESAFSVGVSSSNKVASSNSFQPHSTQTLQEGTADNRTNFANQFEKTQFGACAQSLQLRDEEFLSKQLEMQLEMLCDLEQQLQVDESCEILFN